VQIGDGSTETVPKSKDPKYKYRERARSTSTLYYFLPTEPSTWSVSSPDSSISCSWPLYFFPLRDSGCAIKGFLLPLPSPGSINLSISQRRIGTVTLESTPSRVASGPGARPVHYRTIQAILSATRVRNSAYPTTPDLTDRPTDHHHASPQNPNTLPSLNHPILWFF